MKLRSWILRQDWVNIMGYTALIGLWAGAMASYFNSSATLLAINGLNQMSIHRMLTARAFFQASEVYGWVSVIALIVVMYKLILKRQIKNIVKKYRIDTI